MMQTRGENPVAASLATPARTPGADPPARAPEALNGHPMRRGLMANVFGAFTVVHVYCSILVDIDERNGELSSIITGYKANVREGEAPRDDPLRHAK